MRQRLLCLVLLAGIIFTASCEFDFGEKQEPIHHGTANPGEEITQPFNPELLVKTMHQDMKDRGWLKKQTVVYTAEQDQKDFLKNQKLTAYFKGIAVKDITVIPYGNEANPGKTVVLAFLNTGNPYNAFSTFTAIRQGELTEYHYGERELVIRDNRVLFWEGPYVTMVTVTKMGDDTRNVLLGVAKGISYKFNGMIGTYRAPDLTELVPTYEQRDRSLQVLGECPFQLNKPAIVLQAVYDRDTGEQVLWVMSDPQEEIIKNYRSLLIAKLFLQADTAILASEKNERGESYVWINSSDWGIVEIARKKNVIAVQTNIGQFQPGIKPIAGLKEIAMSGLPHTNVNANVEVNTYKNTLIISQPESKVNTIIMMGITDDVVRRVD